MRDIAVDENDRGVELHGNAHGEIDCRVGLAFARQCTGHHDEIAIAHSGVAKGIAHNRALDDPEFVRQLRPLRVRRHEASTLQAFEIDLESGLRRSCRRNALASRRRLIGVGDRPFAESRPAGGQLADRGFRRRQVLGSGGHIGLPFGALGLGIGCLCAGPTQFLEPLRRLFDQTHRSCLMQLAPMRE